MTTSRVCDRCGGSPAFRAILTLMEGATYRRGFRAGDLCEKCAAKVGQK